MNLLKRHKNRIIISICVVVLLGIVLCWGGDSPALRGRTVEQSSDISAPIKEQAVEDVELAYLEQKAVNGEEDVYLTENQAPSTKAENQQEKKDGRHLTADAKTELAQQMTQEHIQAEEEGSEEYHEFNNDINVGNDNSVNAQIDKPTPIEPDKNSVTNKEMNCALSVRCDTVLDNIKWLDKEKHKLIPDNGVIFEEEQVVFYEGETVFNLLLREMKKNKIHMEFVNTPVYNSVYIEGINNLYEYDCGELSGWVYKVNNWFPNYGCSKYELKEGDKVEFVYTCNLGADVGGRNFLTEE